MGFPTWTLWGMGLSVLGALISTGMAYLVLSTRFAARAGAAGQRLDKRARTLNGYSFALLLLAFGFFLAGVPLGSEAGQAEQTVGAQASLTPDTGGEIETPGADSAGAESTASPTSSSSSESTRTTGAFAGPPPTAPAAGETTQPEPTRASSETVPIETAVLPPEATSTAQVTLTSTPPATSTPTQTPSPTPTVTPSPTMTPTPIDGETAVINTQGSTLWVRRTPGGQPVALVRDRETVILQTGHAHQSGVLWREISTVSGQVGWVQEEYLEFEPAESG